MSNKIEHVKNTGIELIAAERERQIQEEKWTSEHDDKHISEELAEAAAFYALPDKYGELLSFWPWHPDWNKKRKFDRKRQLAIAGALLAAEIDRLNRKDKKLIGVVNQIIQSPDDNPRA